MFYYKGDKYYEWQDDEYSRIGFSAIPDIENKVINKNVMTKDEIKSAKKKPLVLKNEVVVCLVGKAQASRERNGQGVEPCRAVQFNASAARQQINKVYTFTILAGYDYDGASIPRLLWRFIGSKENMNSWEYFLP